MRVFEQSINSGQNFNGTLPSTTHAPGPDIEKRWPIGDAGGLFDFELTSAHVIAMVQLTLGGDAAATWTLSLVDDEDFETVLWSGTDETSFATLAGDEIAILQGQTLKLVTTGTTTVDLKARIGVRKAA